MEDFNKIKKLDGIHLQAKLEKKKSKCDIFIAGPYINIKKSSKHAVNNSCVMTTNRYKLWDSYTKEGYIVYLGEDDRLKEIGNISFGKYSNAVVYEIDHIKKHIDALIVFPSGAGVFCELGSWAILEVICEKMLVIIDKKHEKDKSYMNHGIVKAVKAYNSSVLYIDYNDYDKIKKSCDEFLSDKIDLLEMKKALKDG
ncbi:hypothetical protein K1X45_07100 [Pseudochrobactrum sp. Wa41.01b-1]|uniref:hypothetical protein n=1 Tax=Pseudochrobactrum sp. Wa41.01b-1 TaxID=2864102 RepID=UPI001C687EAB|nr:hypothetical protein [Pseudochrobactrum sp. Wa41.01b-1]QYM74140.1 hypothetical protein K1X45_07100 [Pseudochrobactrum sp. Wa41.01b-1]